MTSYPVKSAFVVFFQWRWLALEVLGSRSRQLDLPQLPLKEEQNQAIHVIYSGSDIFVWLPSCLLDSGRVYVSSHCLSCGDSSGSFGSFHGGDQEE